MQWLNKVVDEVIARQPEGEILVESGGSPSGTYHFGHLRELVTCDAILSELLRRGRQARHIYYVDDLDALRKIPPNVPPDFEKYLGMPLCDIPAPDGSEKSYADYFIQGLIDACQLLGVEVEFIKSHEKYRAGFFAQAIEKALQDAPKIRSILETVSGHKLGDEWSPIQINEDGYLKKRRFVTIDKQAKTVTYEDREGNQKQVGYTGGDVKLDWRIDWPARWWLLAIGVEPAGRDHSTKGGSFDTGLAICKEVFGTPGPLPVQYDFINLAGDNKKMSASAGTGLNAAASAQILPPEVLRFFILRASPSKRLYFDPVDGLVKLIDEFAQLSAKPEKTEPEKQLLDIANSGVKTPTVSQIPFSHLVASYQASLKDPAKTIEFLNRTEAGGIDEPQQEIIKAQLKFIDRWLDEWAPEDVKFELAQSVDASQFTDDQKQYLNQLADEVVAAPESADGEWFHEAIYKIKESRQLKPEEVFKPIYRALIGKDSGPRAGWFLSILPRDWLIKRLRLEG